MQALKRALANLLRIVLLPFWLLGRMLSRPKSPWVSLTLNARLTEFRTRQPLWKRVLPQAQSLQSTALEDLRELAEYVARDPAVVGLLVTVPPLEAGLSSCEGVRKALLSVRGAGKQVVCFLPQGGGQRELYIALAADRILMMPHAAFSPLGFGSHALYVKRLLDRVGIQIEALACGEYKSAAEPAVRETMSEPAREQLEALLRSLHGELKSALCARVGIDAERAEAILGGGLLSASDARAAGVIDDFAYEDEIAGKLQPAEPVTALVAADRYLRFRRARFWQPLGAQPYIAVVPLRGTIVGDGIALGRTTAQLHAVVAALREVAQDARARAVVLYINSPGGSALASELIHREVQRLAQKKPVVAYFGDVAASGGYYVAAACRHIVAQPTTITGSIGVVSMKVSIEPLLERLQVRAEGVRTTPHADMYSALRPLSEAERALLDKHAHELYARFLQVVATGRRLPTSDVEALARGRVWSGRDALSHKLVDALGGIDSAVAHARELLPELSPRRRAALRARVHVSRQAVPPAAEPTKQAAVLEWLPAASEALLAAGRLGAREPALYYAADVIGLD